MRYTLLHPAAAALLAASAAAQFSHVPHAIPAAHSSRHLAIVDHDSDGDQDILVTAVAAANDVVLKMTNPGFAPSTLISYPAGTGIADIAVANLETANTNPDVVTAHGTSNDVRVRRFPAGTQTLVMPAGMVPDRLALLDLERDGDLDLAAIGPGSPLIQLADNAAGVFGAAYNPATLTVNPSRPQAIVASDFNSDGNVDLMVARSDGHMTLFLNTSPLGGPVSFAAGQTYLHPNTRPFGLCADDFNGDGWRDFASADAIGQVTVFLNQGPPSSGAWTTVNFTQTPYSLGGPNFGTWAVACLDFDCDGDVDLVAANNFANQCVALRNNGAGIFAVLAPIGVGQAPRDLAVGDLNGDGHMDAAAADNTGTAPGVSCLINAAGGLLFKQHVYVGGIQDAYASPPPATVEDTCPRPSFRAWMLTQRNFDDAPACDRQFGHTFPNIGGGAQFPAGIVAARLTIVMRPACGGANNDGFGLGFDAALVRFAWGSTVATLPGATGWPTPVTVTLDLANLPGGANLLPKMNADGFLDIYCQDDTEVDSLFLNLTTCNKVTCLFSAKQTPIVAASTWTLSVGGAPPGSWIFWFMGPSVGPGLFLPAGQMCIVPPLFYLGAMPAPAGSAALNVPLPAILPTPCVHVSTQAVSIFFSTPPRWCLSNTWTAQAFQ